MLISSSKSAQCIPSPRPINFQLFRSSGVPWASLGYHAMGTAMVRPSDNSTLKVSSVTNTSVAYEAVVSAAEVPNPCLLYLCAIFFHHFVDFANFVPVKTPALLKSHRIKPKFCDFIIALNVYVSWFISVSCIEKQPIGSCSHYSGHSLTIQFCAHMASVALESLFYVFLGLTGTQLRSRGSSANIETLYTIVLEKNRFV